MSLTDLRSGVTLVTGTDTDVGKTVATAVLAAALGERGRDVALVKPAQTGLRAGEPGDVHEAGRLAGVPPERLHELVRLDEPLAPTTAARRQGVALPDVAEHAARVVALATRHDAVLVEGAGGILVGLDGQGRGLLELADALRAAGTDPRFVVVARAGLGTLNHTQLTCRAITDRGHAVAGVVIGAWPDAPDLAERCNGEEIAALAGAPLLGLIPAGLGQDPDGIRACARRLAAG